MDPLRATVDRSAGRTVITLSGVLDERAARLLQDTFDRLEGIVSINFRGIERINSYGMGLLMKHLSQAARTHSMEFVECSETIVDQFQMLDFTVYGRIKSLFIRYYCSTCGTEDERLLKIDEDIKVDGANNLVAPEFPCSCGGRLCVDESLEFLAEHLES